MNSNSNIPVGFTSTTLNKFLPLVSSFYNDTPFTGQASQIINYDTGKLKDLYDTTFSARHAIRGSHTPNLDPTLTANGVPYERPITAHLENVLTYSTITLNSLRELSAQQSILEKMARTDGSYAQFGQTFFGRSSKNALDYKPILS